MNPQVFMGLGSALLLGSQAHAQETAAQTAARKAITSNYSRFCRACDQNDVKTAMSFLTPDYYIVGTRGTVWKRAAYEKWLRSWAKPPVSLVKTTFKVQKVRWISPSEAVMWEETTMTIYRGSTKAKPTIVRSLGRDYWKKTSKGWLTSRSIQLDGSAENGHQI